MHTPHSQPKLPNNSDLFRHLYDTYAGSLYKVIIDITGNNAEAEAIFLESFRNINERYSTGTGTEKIEYRYLLQVVIQTLIKQKETSINKAAVIEYFQKKMMRFEVVEAA